MKRALSFIISFLLAALVLFISPLPRSLPPYARDFAPLHLDEQGDSTRVAFCVRPLAGNQAGVLNLADLRTGYVSSITPCDKLVQRSIWAPTGSYLALDADYELWGPHGWVVDIERRSVEKIFMENRFGGFQEWTKDGRYAIFEHGDQYGNSETVVFDVLDWKIIFDSQTAPCAITMDGTCKRGPAAAYPQDALLLNNGTLLQLSSLAQSLLVSHQYVSRVKWSPNKAHLALIGYSKHVAQSVAALYLTNADGTEVKAVVDVAGPWGSLQWTPDGSSVTYWDSKTKYVVDVAHLSIQTTPVSKEEFPPSSRQESVCGNAEETRENLLQSVTEISTLCWSHDRKLLGVGARGALKIYDEHLNLLREIPIIGNVSAIAWEPAP
jgi:hypothetical protein